MWFVHDTSLYYGDSLVETFGMIGEAEIVVSDKGQFVAVMDSEGPYVHFFAYDKEKPEEKPEYLTTMRSSGRPIVRFDSDGYLWFNSCLRPGEICVYDAPLLGGECSHVIEESHLLPKEAKKSVKITKIGEYEIMFSMLCYGKVYYLWNICDREPVRTMIELDISHDILFELCEMTGCEIVSEPCRAINEMLHAGKIPIDVIDGNIVIYKKYKCIPKNVYKKGKILVSVFTLEQLPLI